MKSVALSIALSLASGAALADTVTLRADVWCPFNCEPADAQPGYMIEIAKLALEGAGHKVEYATLNWARAIAETRQGAFVGIVGAAKTDAPDFVFPDTAVGSSNNCFFTKPDSKWEYKGIATIPEGAVGVIKDYSYSDEFDEYVKANAKDPKKIDVVSGDNPLELNLKKLQAGRIAAFLEDVSVVKSFLFKKKEEKLLKQAGCINDADTGLYVAFAPKHPKAKEFAKLVSDKVDSMRKDGSLKALLQKYGLEDWKK